MKQIYAIVVTFFWVTINAFSQSEPIKPTPLEVSPFGQEINEVPDDWQNDLWLNTNYQVLDLKDQEYSLVPRRVPEIIDNPISNNIVLPNFNYRIVRGNSVEITENKKIKPIAVGTSIVEVSYDGKEAYGKTYGAVSPVNITYAIFDVVDKTINTGINLTTNITTRSYDTHFFSGNSVNYSFDVTAENHTSLVVKCNDDEAIKDENTFTVSLKNRANIIEIIAKNEIGTKKLFYVIDARKIEITVENLTNPNQDIIAGNQVNVSFKGITLPVYKLATIYNPTAYYGGGNDYARVCYNNTELGTVKTNDSNIGQYSLADHNSISFTLKNPGTYQFSDGHIFEGWWGSILGTEKDMNGPGEPNLNAPIKKDRFSFLPNFEITVETATGFKTPNQSSVSVYPNPVSDNLYVRGESNSYDLVIYNICGKRVFEKRNCVPNEPINLSDLQSGAYIVTISSLSQRYTQKIIKK